MALGGKTSGEIHDKTGGDLAAMVAKYDANAHHSFIGFDEVDVMLHQMQLMQDDIDELRRFVDSASPPLQYAKITIDASEMASLYTTRKTLVAAQGANTMIVPVSCMIRATKLNSGANNTTLANVSVGYGDDIRDLNTLPIMSSKGLLFRRTTGGTLHVAPTGGTTGDISVASDADCVNVELAMCTSADVGVNGASASKVSLLYYVATTS